MSLYARSDLVSVSIPKTSGGCGRTHTRPVINGAPNPTFELTCTDCEAYLRGDGKPKIIKNHPGDKERGIPGRMEHIPDADPFWSSTPEGIPETPDEQEINRIRKERAAQRLADMAAYASMKQAGIPIPDDVNWYMEQQNHDPRVIRGTLFCPRGHIVLKGTKFCGECGTAMGAADELPETVSLEEIIPYASRHVSTLKKECRERGLSDKGTKQQLIERLTT